MDYEDKIFAVDSCNQTVAEAFQEMIPGCEVEDGYILSIEDRVYDIYRLDVCGMDMGSILFYRLN